NITCVSPRNCFKEAFRVGVIDYDEYWIKMIDLRNDTVHSYSEILAEKIYRDLPEALGFFKKLAEIIKKAEAG
ncbi:MAG TPA: nucleotidyltransferase substrate binding protein, partial [Nitrospiria bacterium]|nr:nucleotidyltransferase substrate binding protein [Nitrospiria bacterium]